MEVPNHFIQSVMQNLRNASSEKEKEEILRKAVTELRKQGFNDPLIKKLLQQSIIKEQTNDQMMANNAAYLALLNKVLNKD